MTVLVTGWFSFEVGHTTAGDLLAKDIVCSWLRERGVQLEVAATPPFEGQLEWSDADPAKYTHVVFVCGPFRPGWPLTEFLEHFQSCRLVGINVSMLEPTDRWNPFETLLARDSDREDRPDITFLSSLPLAPVVGVSLVHPQSEYRDRQRHDVVNGLIGDLLASRDAAVVEIDTRLDVNRVGLRSPAQVEGLISRMDLVVTTRLHGLVLALKNGVPALAVDPIAGGAKIKHQGDVLGWPIVFTPETATRLALAEAFDYCLMREARDLARECRKRARRSVGTIKDEFLAAIGHGTVVRPSAGSQ